MLHSSLSLIWASVSQAGMLKPLWVGPTTPHATHGTQAPSSRSLGPRRWTEGCEAGRAMSRGQSAEVYVRFTVRM